MYLPEVFDVHGAQFVRFVREAAYFRIVHFALLRGARLGPLYSSRYEGSWVRRVVPFGLPHCDLVLVFGEWFHFQGASVVVRIQLHVALRSIKREGCRVRHNKARRTVGIAQYFSDAR